MGYRIYIQNKSHTLTYYGTKHYGYCKIDASELSSFKYLVSIGKFKSDDSWIFDFGIDIDDAITLTAEQFNTFIKLYNEEYMSGISYNPPHNMLENPSMVELINDKEDKEVKWG